MNNNSLKLISLNIEGSNHLELVENFLRTENPDVVCLQEVYKKDLPRLVTAAGAIDSYFAPMAFHTLRDDEKGQSFLSRHKFSATHKWFAGAPDGAVPTAAYEGFEVSYASRHFSLLVAQVVWGGQTLTFSTTHLPVTEHAKVTDFQKEALHGLLQVLDSLPSFILTGDLNAPRGGEIFTQLAKKYTDNIPAHYTTSLDQQLHRAAPLELMVDGLFSTDDFLVSNVRLQDGVSDHCAFCADVSKCS